MKTLITEVQKAELVEFGYTVEDIGAVWGPEHNGTYRWWLGDDFQDYEPSYSEDAAWYNAWLHYTGE